MNNFEFYQNLNYVYPELAICLSDSVDGIASFYIPILTPSLETETGAYDIEDNNVRTHNILSDTSSMEINACTASNYLDLKLPKFRMYNKELNEFEEIDDVCHKGDKFVVVFVGGDPEKPVLLGRYYDALNY